MKTNLLHLQLHLTAQHPQIRSHIGLVGQRVLNAYQLNNEIMGWHKGDLVVHLAGCWVKDHCAQSWDEMWRKKEKAAPKGTYLKNKDQAKAENERIQAEEKLKEAEEKQEEKDKEAEVKQEEKAEGLEGVGGEEGTEGTEMRNRRRRRRL